MARPVVYLFFFCSGISGLIYQVVWVRAFTGLFGNTIASASVVFGVFLLGLGVGSGLAGAWTDTRDTSGRGSRLRDYAWLEGAIAALGLAVTIVLPRLDSLAALASTYVRDANGWHTLSTASYLARIAIASVTLGPPTVAMGATLTVLVRHLANDTAPTKAAGALPRLYAVNTIGAAVGALLTDYALIPALGLRTTALVAVALNALAAMGAWLLARRAADAPRRPSQSDPAGTPRGALGRMGVALALSGYAAMATEVLWLRHVSILLGELRAVLALLLATVLLGMGLGASLVALLSGRVSRGDRGPGRDQSGADPAVLFAVAQGLLVVATLGGLLLPSARAVGTLANASGPMAATTSLFADIAFNARPILLLAGVPSVLMGMAFPLAVAVVQRGAQSIGRVSGVLYLANTVGAVAGSVTAGFALLPLLGMQAAALVPAVCAMAAGAIAVVPARGGRGIQRSMALGALTAGAVALGLWAMLPTDVLLMRLLLVPRSRIHALSESVTEVIAVTDGPNGGRVLVTNGHPMSSTELYSQRYMRAMAHVPLLMSDHPRAVLVICYGVGNTAHAVSLHDEVARIDVADLSRHVLEHAPYFRDVNGDVLHDPRVSVYVNDGRHHLRMTDRQYDLITLEPPPIVHAGVAALYSTEFYALARARLAPNGHITQWLPAFGVPQSIILSMARSFLEVFPNAVVLSGAGANLLLLGGTGPGVTIDPVRLEQALQAHPAVRADLARLDLGTPREIVGMFVGSARTMASATRDLLAVSDDRPLLEYSQRSLVESADPIPPTLVDTARAADWCPACFADGRPVPVVAGLDTYLALTTLAYTAPAAETARLASAGASARVIAGSGYLGSLVPESATLHATLARALEARGSGAEALREWQTALRLDPTLVEGHFRVGMLLGVTEESIEHLGRAAALDPRNGEVQYALGTTLLSRQDFAAATDRLRAAVALLPESAEARNNLGIALAAQGRLPEATEAFRAALALRPDFADARRNLQMATRR
jgi:spermidine synthase